MIFSAEYAPALLAFVGGIGVGVIIRMRLFPRPSPVGVAAGVAPKELRLEPRRGLVALAEVMREVVLVLDESDRLVFFNDAARALPGMTGELIGRDAAVLVRSADFLDCLRKFRAGSGVPGTTEILIRRAPIAPDLALEAAFTGLPESAGFGPGSLAVVMTDVSRLRRLENLRREFVANVSHDLRTPVTIVKGAAHMLVEDYAEMDDVDRLRFLEKIQRNTKRLHILLEDLLELSSLEDSGAAALHTERGRLHAELRDTAEALADRLVSAGLTVEFDLQGDDARVAVDAPKFSRVVQNLLENTLRYASGATHVRFSTRIESDRFLLRLEDNGPGVAQSEYGKVFERFYRAEKSRSTAGGGSGLGLSIVKHILLSHGGTVCAEPAIPRGFAVAISLPCLPE